jgi:hypothetical protein
MVMDRGSRKKVPVPPYSTQTDEAYSVIAHYKALGCSFNLKNEDDGTWNVKVTHPKLAGLFIGGQGETLAHAICNCAIQFNSLFTISK